MGGWKEIWDKKKEIMDTKSSKSVAIPKSSGLTLGRNPNLTK